MNNEGLRSIKNETGQDKYNPGMILWGILLVIFGLIALGSVVAVSLASVIVFGVLLVISGIAQIILSFRAGGFGGFMLNLFMGILYLVLGAFIFLNPVLSLASLTLLLALFFIVAGLFRIIVSLFDTRIEDRSWIFFGGVIAFILGMMVYNRWPISSLWILGLFIGIELIVSGVSWISLEFRLRKRDDLTLKKI